MSEIIGEMIGYRLARRRARRKAQELLKTNQVLSGVRVVDGETAGLSRSWLTGPWRVEPGTIFIAGISVSITHVSDGWREASMRELWSVDDDAEIVRMRSGDTVLEWALPPYGREWAVLRVNAQ